MVPCYLLCPLFLFGTGGGKYDTGHVFPIKETAEETWESVCNELITHYGKGGFRLLRNSRTRVRTQLTACPVVCIAPPTRRDGRRRKTTNRKCARVRFSSATLLFRSCIAINKQKLHRFFVARGLPRKLLATSGASSPTVYIYIYMSC